jgi:PAS domain S-box-containing protein
MCMMKNISSAIIESMSDGLIVLDFHGNITRMNPAASELLGIKMKEIEDMTYFQLFMNEPGNDAFNDLLLNGIQHGETRLYGEAPFRRRDGRCLDLAVTTSFLRAEPEEKDKAGIVVVFKDITEFKALDRARRRVLDHLSHELKTPLSIILSSLKRLESSRNERSIERIRRNLIRLQDIQMEVEDIVKQRNLEGKHDKLTWLEQTLDFVELLEEEEPIHKEALHLFRARIEDFYKIRKSKLQNLKMGEHIQQVVGSAKRLSSHRAVALLTRIKVDAHLIIDPDVL